MGRLPPGPTATPRLAVLALLLACCDGSGAPAPTASNTASIAPVAARSGVDGDAPPTVLLVTLDTTRADRVGVYDAAHGVTPRLDALAAGGLVFSQARATQPVTLPSHTSMLTGTYPSAHGVRDNGLFVVSPESLLVSEVLSARGFATGAFVGSFVLAPRWGLDQGFDVYGTPPVRRLGQPLKGADRPADEVVTDALAWLDGVPAERPLLLWVHLFDAHFPYAPPEPFRSRYANPYDGEVAFADAQFGRLLDGLDARGRKGPRLTIVAADHGEGLGEHGEAVHGVFVYDSTVRVPLVVAGDGVPTGRVADPVSLADVAPTVLHWLGLPRTLMPAVRVPSLLATAAGRPDGDEGAGSERIVPVESWLPWYEHGWHPQRAVVWREHKLIDTRRPELYDLGADPGETRDRSAELPRLRDELAQAQRRLDAGHPPLRWALDESPGDDERRALAGLGYTGDARGDVPGADAPDAKDRLPDLARREQALWLLWNGRRRMGIDGVLAEWPRPPRDPSEAARYDRGRDELQRARTILEELLVANPGDAEFSRYLGVVMMAMGDAEAALPMFERVVKHRPLSAEAHFDLAAACEHSGRGVRAHQEMQASVRLEPRAVRATLWLAEWHLTRGESGHAAWWLRTLLGEAGLAATDDESDPDVLAVAELLAEALDRAARDGLAVEPPPGVTG